MTPVTQRLVNDMMDAIDQKFVDFVNEEWSTMSEARIDALQYQVIEGLIKRLQGE